MQALIFPLLTWLANNLAGRILASLGLALAGSFTFGSFIEYFIDKALSTVSTIPLTGLIGLAGLDTAVSIMLSAVMIRLYISQITQSINIVRSPK